MRGGYPAGLEPFTTAHAANAWLGRAARYPRRLLAMVCKASLSGSVIDTVTKTGNLRTVPMECHGDDTPLTFHDTILSSLLILLIHVSNLMFMTLL